MNYSCELHSLCLYVGSLRRSDGQDPRLRRLRLRPIFQTRRHRRGATSRLPARPRVDHRQVEGAAEHRRRRRRKFSRDANEVSDDALDVVIDHMTLF